MDNEGNLCAVFGDFPFLFPTCYPFVTRILAKPNSSLVELPLTTCDWMKLSNGYSLLPIASDNGQKETLYL